MINKKYNYKQWMKQYIKDNNGFWDLARDIFSDENFPSSKRYMVHFEYLISVSACDAAIDVLRETWLEYEESYGDRYPLY